MNTELKGERKRGLNSPSLSSIKSREEKKELIKKIFYTYCPICNKEIKGTKQSQVEYNLKLHLDSHRKKEVK